ncbi:MAG: 3-oxoacid CoA-transferase subunit B [Candidatus Baltobacteraceae bacterium]|jgi:acetate CoA/acetoacetate CoA-transferase beta subunit
METRELIARRAALELRHGTLVNVGIGLPTLVPRFLPEGVEVYFQSENGLIGMEPVPEQGMEDEFLTDAGGGAIGAIPGACTLDASLSFGLIRGGHLDLSVLGGLQVDELGRLANWLVPGKMVAGMGGAMDIVTGAKRVIVAMAHTTPEGQPRLVRRCTYPLTSLRRVDLVITELAVIEPVEEGLVLRELAPGVSLGEVLAHTEARLIVPSAVPSMQLAA